MRVGSLEAEAPFRYLRLREPPYSDDDLRGWAERLRPLLDDGIRDPLLLQARGRADRA